MKIFTLALVTLLSAGAHAQNFCAGEVNAPAAKLLALHQELSEAQAANLLSGNVKELPPIKAPNGKRKYVVLETEGYLGKTATARIRMIFAVLGKTDPKKDCLLMGQEILDMSSLD